MPSSIRKLRDFEGRWHLNRQIVHDNDTTAHFIGHAVWEPDGNGLLYSETGKLAIAGQAPMTATRRYFWHPDLSVSFEDGRFFHAVPAQGGFSAHWCDPDQYEVTYDFQDWPEFQVKWHVSGPRKNYTMTGNYKRC